MCTKQTNCRKWNFSVFRQNGEGPQWIRWLVIIIILNDNYSEWNKRILFGLCLKVHPNRSSLFFPITWPSDGVLSIYWRQEKESREWYYMKLVLHNQILTMHEHIFRGEWKKHKRLLKKSKAIGNLKLLTAFLGFV